MKQFRIVIALILALGLTSAPTYAAVSAGSKCTKVGAILSSNSQKFTCVKSGNKLIWIKGVIVKKVAKPASEVTKKPNEQTTSSSDAVDAVEVELPVERTHCPKLGVKISGSNGYMKCIWEGGPTNDFLNNVRWRFYQNPKAIKTGGYSTQPVEKASCESSGDTFSISGGELECRWTIGRKLAWVKVNTIKGLFANAKSPVSIDVCKLQNSASTADKTGRNSGAGLAGFPLINTNKNGMNIAGSNEVLIVPVDFPDYPGGDAVLKQLDNDTKWMKNWIRYFSNDKSQFNISTVNKWFRMPKERAAYPSDAKTDETSNDPNGRQGNQAQALIDEITKEVDLRKFSTIYIFYPDGEITFVDWIVRNHRFKIKEGEKNLNLFSWGRNLEGMETMKWAFYIHESMHDFNLLMHAPGNGWPFSIGTNQSGISLAINPWEQFLLDWLPSDQIYCDDVSSLKQATISLSPVEREDHQTKMAVLKLSPTKAIVIESHGIEKWSDFKFGDREFPPGFYSVMAYIVDLDKSVAPPIYADGTSVSNNEWAWAVFQKVEAGASNDFNVNLPDGLSLSSYVAVLGDSFVIEGVRIKFIATGDYSTISISKA